jgi:hypothetical protein
MAMEPQAGGRAPLAMRARTLRPARNPVRRASDRAEFAVPALLLVAFLAGWPLTAMAAAHWAAASGLRAERARPGWHQVRAVLWRRVAAWDADWTMTEPQWTGRH